MSFMGMGSGASAGMMGTNAFNAAGLFSWWMRRSGARHNRQNAEAFNKMEAQITTGLALQMFSSRFRWGGEAISHLYQGYIETMIFMNGFVVVHLDPEYGLVVLPAAATNFNIYYMPNRFQLNGMGYSKNVSIEDCVVIKDNSAWNSPAQICQRRSAAIADLFRAIEVYIDGCKTPTIIAANDKSALTAETIIQAKLSNEPYLIVSPKTANKAMKEGAREVFQFFNTAHNSADLNGLITARQSLISELAKTWGMSASSRRGSQYVSESEQERDDQQMGFILQDAARQRLDAIERIYDKWGLMLECEVSPDFVFEDEETPVKETE